jgi:threonylcarbamoyladenosine tRNA methylthiotransferase MtaB
MALRTFYVIGGNCPRSKEDAQTIFNYFLKNGLKPVKKIKKADIICIYTCGGFNSTEELSIKTIKDLLQKKSKNAIIIVTGCLTRINPGSIYNINGIKIMDLYNLEDLDEIIHPKIKFKQIPNAGTIGSIPPLYKDEKIKKLYTLISNPNFIKNISIANFLNYIKKISFRKNNTLFNKNVYNIRISRGCLGSCSYCSIKLAHGCLQSKPIEQIQKDFEVGLKKGYKTFTFIGQDIGCYGLDIKTNIVEVLKIFFKNIGENKIILNDFNPKWFVKYYDELEPLFIANHKNILSLLTPIQSGSNNILKPMGRGYKIEEVKRCISTLKEKIPDLKIRTHIIVGFPGETKEDFQQTLNLLKEIQFFSVDLFPYSDRIVTEAFKMKDKISSDVIQERMEQIYKMNINIE